MLCRTTWKFLIACAALVGTGTLSAQEAAFKPLQAAYAADVRALVTRYCHECHSGDQTEGDIDLAIFASLEDVRKHPRVWQKVAEMLDSGQMPPKDSKQLTEPEQKQLRAWVRDYLTLEARVRAGDPGPVVLRRLNNVEYTYTLRDLTGVATLAPAKEFPVDGAAGEGFTNTGQALVMSPALVTKYLDAAKGIADHAVLLPDGIRFSPHTTPSDWTQDTLAEIREFYRRYTDPRGGDKVNLQGVVFDTNQGGRLPLEKYLAALLTNRDGINDGTKPIIAVALEHGLSPKYLSLLWTKLNGPSDDGASLLLNDLRQHWKQAKPADAPALAAEVARWQQSLWRFTSVGHIGKLNGPKAWMEPVSPLAARQDFKLKLPDVAPGQDVTLYLAAGDAGDGTKQDNVVWERPRFVAPGRPELLLRDVPAVMAQLAAAREQLLSGTTRALAAAAEASDANARPDVAKLAEKHRVDPRLLSAWLAYLGINSDQATSFGTPITRRNDGIGEYKFIRGWVGDEALSVLANSSDQHVRIPGNMQPHSVAVHPAPKFSVLVGWRSPLAGQVRISGSVQHAHPECGNGVAWALELRRGNTRQRLAVGNSERAKVIAIGPLEKIKVIEGDIVALVISPRDGDHSCDLTAVDLKLSTGDKDWSLWQDVSPDIHAGNPHADRHGNKEVWHFAGEPTTVEAAVVAIPAGSLLAGWQTATIASEREKLAAEVQALLLRGASDLPNDSPDAALHRQLTSLRGPLLSAMSQAIAVKTPGESAAPTNSRYGLSADKFGKQGDGPAIDAASLAVAAPAILEVRLPADLVAGAEFVTSGTLSPATTGEGSVQLSVSTTRPELGKSLQPADAKTTDANGPWTANNRGVAFGTPVIVADNSAARKRFEASYEEFRQLFPAALCYTKIVPVDEVVTLTLFYREDDQLMRLMLDPSEQQHLNKLWDELHYVSQDALTLVDAYAQLMEYATQDADPKVFEPLRKPIHDRAAAFRQQLIDTESKHLESVLKFAGEAYRRPLSDKEAHELRALYARLRKEEHPHDAAIRLTLARVLVAPAFLYRLEQPVAGAKAGAVTDDELASRLSYFLWSSQPDAELRQLAAEKKLHQPDVLRAQMRRMLRDPKSRRLAEEFACQWLHIHGFDTLDEKSERHFPTFAGLRESMYEESILFFHDLFQNNGSVLSVLDADHTFLNEELAKHYGIPNVAGANWRRVDGVRQYARGGILSLATTLATQSGASRTSPILRGNWISEVLLGEKLPRPPKNVPQLEDTVPAGLTERQLIERHSSDAACAKCHQRIDPLGFALEDFDAIGRFRERDAAGLPIDAKTTLPDGTKLDGAKGLRDYLLTTRRDAFVRQFNRKLLGYALARGVQLSDEPLLAQMQAELKANEYHVENALEAIVLSPQFREIRGRDGQYQD